VSEVRYGTEYLRVAFLLTAVIGGGCATTPTGVFAPPVDAGQDGSTDYEQVAVEVPADDFAQEPRRDSVSYADVGRIAQLTGDGNDRYRLGPGDVFEFQVRGRPDISVAEVIVSPDGRVALPRVGIIEAAGHTVDDFVSDIRGRLEKYYQSPSVTVIMKRYENNKVYVLGRVANPGVVHLPGAGTLLEALSLAGGMPADTQKTFLSRCMIVRGSDLAIWVDLRDLLHNGNMSLNARLRNGDVIFIPQSEDQMAYVMGEVVTPRAMLLRSDVTVLDAIMQAGGCRQTGDLRRVHLVRAFEGRGSVQAIDIQAMIETGDLRKNYVLRDGDIIYVAATTMGKFNYFLRQLSPSMEVVNFAVDTAESFGAMQELRNQIWGQEGFVNGD
jgi:polysaccharide export outer membrane protein